MQKKAYHHGNLREALLQSARETLASDGIEALSLRAVARRTGVSATALYSHFKDKQELLTRLAARGFDELAVEMEREQARADRGESAGGLVALARGYVAFATHNPALFQLMFGPAPGEVLAEPHLQRAGARAYGLLEADVAKRMGSLGMPEQTPVATAGAWALVHGLSSLLNDGRISAEKLGLPDNAALTENVCGLLDIG